MKGWEQVRYKEEEERQKALNQMIESELEEFYVEPSEP